MRRIELEFMPRSPQWPLWALLIIALALLADAAGNYFSLQQALRDSRRPPEVQRALPPSDAGVPESTRRELESARRVLQDLALPWGALFRSVETAVGRTAALLSIEPDAARGQVRVTGEARDYPAVIDLMKRLEESRILERVHLVSHEVREDDPQRPVHFALVGSWRASR